MYVDCFIRAYKSSQSQPQWYKANVWEELPILAWPHTTSKPSWLVKCTLLEFATVLLAML